jgi:hypothetical protein
MNGYCPAGKCECGRYMESVLTGEYCSFGWEPTNRFEQCPWPSKQISLDVISKEEVDLLIDLQKSTAHAAGRLAGLQEAMDAVANIRLRFDSDTPGNVDLTLPEFQWVRDKAIAAIDRLMGVK